MRFHVFASLAVTAVVAGSAYGQSRGSFQNVDGFSSLSVVENNSLSYTMSLGAAPMVRVAGVDYPITAIFGFWSLSDDDNFTSAAGSNFGLWTFDRSSAGAGDIAGWKTNPNTGIVPGGSQTFLYSALSSSQRERYGFHITTAQVVPGQQALTFYATGGFIPTPGSLGVLAGAGVLAMRRRRA